MKNVNDIIWLDNVDSTNEEAKRRFHICDNLSVLSALSQSSGRGQMGNVWLSESGSNLTFSIILKLDEGPMSRIQAYDQFAVCEIAALAVSDYLNSHDIPAMIKWPNDIYVNDKKICGILIENRIRGEWLSGSIIGIGLNVNQETFDASLPNPTSMCLETSRKYDIQECLEDFMHIFKEYHDRYLNIKGGMNRLRTLYLAQMWHKDECHRYIAEGKEFEGIIRGISDIGRLIVETEKGELKEFAFKEIEYII